MQLDDARRLVLLIILALVLVGLVAFARGPEHHHGPQQVGAHADGTSVAAATLG